MSVVKHRVVAASILAAGVVVLLAWGRSQAEDPADVRAAREKLRGRWVATLVQAGENRKAEGPSVSDCRAEFDGKSVAFRHLIGGIDTRGTYHLDPKGDPDKVDFKLDAGWSMGVFEVGPDSLRLAMNSFMLPERLGVPNRSRPGQVRAGEDRHLYVFRRARPGE